MFVQGTRTRNKERKREKRETVGKLERERFFVQKKYNGGARKETSIVKGGSNF